MEDEVQTSKRQEKSSFGVVLWKPQTHMNPRQEAPQRQEDLAGYPRKMTQKLGL